jgi:hypothetical protein
MGNPLVVKETVAILKSVVNLADPGGRMQAKNDYRFQITAAPAEKTQGRLCAPASGMRWTKIRGA